VEPLYKDDSDEDNNGDEPMSSASEEEHYYDDDDDDDEEHEEEEHEEKLPLPGAGLKGKLKEEALNDDIAADQIDEFELLSRNIHPVPDELRCPRDPHCLNKKNHNGRCRLIPRRPKGQGRRRRSDAGASAGKSNGGGGISAKKRRRSVDFQAIGDEKEQEKKEEEDDDVIGNKKRAFKKAKAQLPTSISPPALKLQPAPAVSSHIKIRVVQRPSAPAHGAAAQVAVAPPSANGNSKPVSDVEKIKMQKKQKNNNAVHHNSAGIVAYSDTEDDAGEAEKEDEVVHEANTAEGLATETKKGHEQCINNDQCIKPNGHTGWCRVNPPVGTDGNGVAAAEVLTAPVNNDVSPSEARKKQQQKQRSRGQSNSTNPSLAETDPRSSQQKQQQQHFSKQRKPSGSSLSPLPTKDNTNNNPPSLAGTDSLDDACFSKSPAKRERKPLPQLTPRGLALYKEACRRGPNTNDPTRPTRSAWELHRIDLPSSEACQSALRGEWDPSIGDPKPPRTSPTPIAHRSHPNQFLNAEFVALVGDMLKSQGLCARSVPLQQYTALKNAYLQQFEMTDALPPQPGPMSSTMVAFGLKNTAAPVNISCLSSTKVPTWMDITAVNGEMSVRREASNIHGFGLVAREKIDEGSFITELVGEVVPTQEAARRLIKYEREPVDNITDIYQRHNDDVATARKVKTHPPGDAYMFRLDGAWVIDATVAGSAARFINHSCEPNAEARVVKGIDDRRHVILFALRDIASDEEVCIDYGLVHMAGKPELKCRCGSTNCCGRIDRPR
jgi:hypothetical protein